MTYLCFLNLSHLWAAWDSGIKGFSMVIEPWPMCLFDAMIWQKLFSIIHLWGFKTQDHLLFKNENFTTFWVWLDCKSNKLCIVHDIEDRFWRKQTQYCVYRNNSSLKWHNLNKVTAEASQLQQNQRTLANWGHKILKSDPSASQTQQVDTQAASVKWGWSQSWKYDLNSSHCSSGTFNGAQWVEHPCKKYVDWISVEVTEVRFQKNWTVNMVFELH